MTDKTSSPEFYEKVAGGMIGFIILLFILAVLV